MTQSAMPSRTRPPHRVRLVLCNHAEPATRPSRPYGAARGRGAYNALVTFEDAATRLVMLAQLHCGTVTAAQVESSSVFGEDRELVSAAARALAASATVRSADEPDGRQWFPFSSLTFGTRAR